MKEKYLKTEKEKFTEPEIEIIRFETVDIITTSGDLDEDETSMLHVGGTE